MTTKDKFTLADMANDGERTNLNFKEGSDYLDSIPELIKKQHTPKGYIWVGEGCEDVQWIVMYEPIYGGRFRVVSKVKPDLFSFDPSYKIETFNGITCDTIYDLKAKVEDALFQLKKAREELAEYIRIKRKAEVRNAAGEYEV